MLSTVGDVLILERLDLLAGEDTSLGYWFTAGGLDTMLGYWFIAGGIGYNVKGH